MSFAKILCAVDFSAPSRAAMETAVRLARETSGAELTLVHVYYLPVLATPELMLPVNIGEIKAAAEKALAGWRADALALGASRVEAITIQGAPWDMIVDAAKRGGHDLVVVGTQGRTGLKHVLIGSVAEKVVRHAPCAVLVVR